MTSRGQLHVNIPKAGPLTHDPPLRQGNERHGDNLKSDYKKGNFNSPFNSRWPALKVV